MIPFLATSFGLPSSYHHWFLSFRFLLTTSLFPSALLLELRVATDVSFTCVPRPPAFSAFPRCVHGAPHVRHTDLLLMQLETMPHALSAHIKMRHYFSPSPLPPSCNCNGWNIDDDGEDPNDDDNDEQYVGVVCDDTGFVACFLYILSLSTNHGKKHPITGRQRPHQQKKAPHTRRRHWQCLLMPSHSKHGNSASVTRAWWLLFICLCFSKSFNQLPFISLTSSACCIWLYLLQRCACPSCRSSLNAVTMTFFQELWLTRRRAFLLHYLLFQMQSALTFRPNC